MEFLRNLNTLLKSIRLDRDFPQLIHRYTREQSKNQDRPFQALLEIVQDEEFKDDEAAFKFLKKKHGNLSRNQYAILKNRLFKRLANLVTLINPNNFQWESYKKSYFNAYKNLMIARFLAITQAKNTSLYFARRTFSLAKKFEMFELYSNISGFLAQTYADLGDHKSYTFYKDAYWEGIKQYQAEQEALFAYQDWAVYFYNHSTFDSSLENDLKTSIEKIEQVFNNAPSFVTYLYLVRLKSIYYELTYRFSNLISLWDDFDNYLNKNPQFKLKIQQFESAIKKMNACLNNKDFEKGTRHGEEAKGLFKPGLMNWFIFQEYWFLLMMHKREFSKAYEILNTIFSSSQYERLPDTLKEKWILMNGYVAFLIESNWDPDFSQKYYDEEKPFRVNKLLNQFPKGSQDKAGVNTMVLILKFLFYLNRNDYDKLISLQEPLRTYYYRYLRNAYQKRKLSLLVKMLNKIIKKDFDYEKILHSTEKDFKNLTNTRIYYEGGYEDLEVIPFEEIWDWVLMKVKSAEKEDLQANI